MNPTETSFSSILIPNCAHNVLTGCRGTNHERNLQKKSTVASPFPTFLHEMERKWRSTARLLLTFFIFLAIKLDQVDVLTREEVRFSIGLGEIAEGSVCITKYLHIKSTEQCLASS